MKVPDTEAAIVQRKVQYVKAHGAMRRAQLRNQIRKSIAAMRSCLDAAERALDKDNSIPDFTNLAKYAADAAMHTGNLEMLTTLLAIVEDE